MDRLVAIAAGNGSPPLMPGGEPQGVLANTPCGITNGGRHPMTNRKMDSPWRSVLPKSP
jgi:hypothetical protein